MYARLLLLALLLSGCVNVDPVTGQTVPRGGQRYLFETVQRRVDRLYPGMPRGEVLVQLGSPAQRSEDHATWYYLPERAGVLLPARALWLQFDGEVLAKYGYRPIVFGQTL